MNLLLWINVLLAMMGLWSLGFGIWVLVTGRMTRRLAGQYADAADAGKYFVGFGLFFLLMIFGYFGNEAGLFSASVRGLLVLAGLAVGMIVFIRYRPGRRRA